MYQEYGYSCADTQPSYQTYMQQADVPQKVSGDMQQNIQYVDQTSTVQDKPQQYYSMNYDAANYGHCVNYNAYISGYNFGLPQYNHAYNYSEQWQSYNQYTTTLPRSDTPPNKPMNDSGIEISPIIPHQSYTNNIKQTNEQFQVSLPDDDCNDDDESVVDDDEDLKTTKQSFSNDSKSLIKPPKAYLEIIADAILSSSKRMMQLHEIYHYMEKRYPYFAQQVNRSWRNSVRHNLSLNVCFVKAGRGTNGKGNYWRIHTLCEPDFLRGNFRRKNFKQIIKSATFAPNSQRIPSNMHNQHYYQQ